MRRQETLPPRPRPHPRPVLPSSPSLTYSLPHHSLTPTSLSPPLSTHTVAASCFGLPCLFLALPSAVFSHSASRFSSLHRPSISGTLGVAAESLEASAAQQTTFPTLAYHLSTSPLIVTLIASLKGTWCVCCSTGQPSPFPTSPSLHALTLGEARICAQK